MNNQVKIFSIAIIVLILGTVATAVVRSKPSPEGPGKYDQFAVCLGEKGAKFYGAWWCPHCAKQKKLFGSSDKLLPYIECSEKDGKTQTPICIEKKIEGYPTWELADGTRLPTENEDGVSLKTLSEKTGCPLPPEE